MKKIVLILAAMLILSAFAITAFASETDKTSVSNALYSLGLVKGYDDSGSDFRLENKLTRAEAVVQIIRFLGVGIIEPRRLSTARREGSLLLSFDILPYSKLSVKQIYYLFENCL